MKRPKQTTAPYTPRLTKHEALTAIAELLSHEVNSCADAIESITMILCLAGYQVEDPAESTSPEAM